MNWSSKMQSNHSARWFHWKDSESNAKVRDEGCAEKDESGPTHWDARQRNPSVKLTMKLRWKRIHSLMSNEKQKEEEKRKKEEEWRENETKKWRQNEDHDGLSVRFKSHHFLSCALVFDFDKQMILTAIAESILFLQDVFAQLHSTFDPVSPLRCVLFIDCCSQSTVVLQRLFGGIRWYHQNHFFSYVSVLFLWFQK